MIIISYIFFNTLFHFQMNSCSENVLETLEMLTDFLIERRPLPDDRLPTFREVIFSI